MKMELTWFFFSILATLLFGLAMALYKVPSVKKQSRFATAFWAQTVSAIFAFVFFYSYLSLSSPAMVWTALLWGFTFSCIVLLQMYAVSKVDTNVVFPITTTASLVITVLAGIFFFKESTTSLQNIGIIIAILTIFLFLYKGGKIQFSATLIGVGSGIIFISAFNKILQKVVAESFDIHVFQIYQYLFAAIFSLLIFSFVHRNDWRKQIISKSIQTGSLIGIFGFFGGYSLYVALTNGPFPLIASIHSFYIFVTALVGYFLFQEKLDSKKILLLLFAVISIILIRIG